MTDLLERDWQDQLVELARLLGWRSMHVRRSVGRRHGARGWQTTTSVDGWPDLVLWREDPNGGELLFVELKSDTGRLRPAQRQVLDSLTAAGQEVHVWRPSDLERVQERLARHRRAS